MRRHEPNKEEQYVRRPLMVWHLTARKSRSFPLAEKYSPGPDCETPISPLLAGFPPDILFKIHHPCSVSYLSRRQADGSPPETPELPFCPVCSFPYRMCALWVYWGY